MLSFFPSIFDKSSLKFVFNIFDGTEGGSDDGHTAVRAIPTIGNDGQL